jgi:hypothetical protein
MKKILLLLLISGNLLAGFFDGFIPTPSKMMDFYNQNKSDMLPFFDREKRLESQNADSVMEGDVEYLQADGKKVFSIFMEGEESDNNNKADVGIILLHTRGTHPNEEKTIKPLRINLAEHGYNTLSVQMPVLEKSAKYYDYVPILSHSHSRIKAAIDFYKKMGIKKIVFISHGCGGHMLMSYIDKFGDKDINGVIGIGMGATDTNQTVVKQYPLATMQAPVLDVIGSKDYGSVKSHFKTRLPHLKLGNKNSKQVVLKGNKHYHNSKKEFTKLTNIIYEFLEKI